MSECSICLDVFEEDNCATLECGHSFHDQCIKVYKTFMLSFKLDFSEVVGKMQRGLRR